MQVSMADMISNKLVPKIIEQLTGFSQPVNNDFVLTITFPVSVWPPSFELEFSGKDLPLMKKCKPHCWGCHMILYLNILYPNKALIKTLIWILKLQNLVTQVMINGISQWRTSWPILSLDFNFSSFPRALTLQKFSPKWWLALDPEVSLCTKAV